MITLHVDSDTLPTPGGNPKAVFVLLHGFTNDGTAWDSVRDILRSHGRTVAVDLIGHGRSPAPPEVSHYTLSACLDQLEEVLDRLGLSNAWWVGYSMGARVALQMAIHRPHCVQGLILESGTPGLETSLERAQRAAEDEALANKIETHGVPTFIEEWLERPLFAGLKRLPPEQQSAARARRLKNNARGLANSLRGMGTGMMPSGWSALAGLKVPTLLLAGEKDPKFLEIARRMERGIPKSRIVVIPGSGHAIHEEQPAAWKATVGGFLAEVLTDTIHHADT